MEGAQRSCNLTQSHWEIVIFGVNLFFSWGFFDWRELPGRLPSCTIPSWWWFRLCLECFTVGRTTHISFRRTRECCTTQGYSEYIQYIHIQFPIQHICDTFRYQNENLCHIVKILSPFFSNNRTFTLLQPQKTPIVEFGFVVGWINFARSLQNARNA